MHLMLAALLLLQDKDTEDLLKKIEEPILRAKTLRVGFVLTTDEKGKKTGGPGSMFLKEQNKVHFSLETGESIGARKLMAMAICDGRMVGQSYGPLGHMDEAPPTFALAFRMTFARVGMALAGSFCTEYAVSKNLETLKIAEMLPVSELKKGENDGAWGTLSYQVRVSKSFVKGLEEPLQVKTWYQPESFKPAKRTLTIKVSGKEQNFLETYDPVILDEAIADDKFKLPEK